ncbi:acyltransferase family protein [Asticcacaulis sp. ZE23SCel15]|uniref:acyltransferase family protein n=1 Tax=Asticcacaulis sp. ZE23SCel15 TaxID=3059027 RepID=UPI00265F9011|nr:acyltransferase family protein [Asticcacaulis sp. ZE23SCel15]WKL56269.1 acyltransferase family protein [Asticcacaulis sp. ZE23SCel15]
MKYRPDIDGLRALALLPVMLSHAGFSMFSGGFVGVDVFFVISGYLITRILADEIAEGRFSLLKFYERRVRRIAPALTLVMAVSIPFAWFTMLPEEFRDFGQSLIAVNLFLSNVFFLGESGYFEGAAEYKPFLHTWSLAVEEQFYFLFPLALLVAWRFARRHIMIVFSVMALLSLIWAEYNWRHDPNATFYLLMSRAWELLAGALLALGLHKSAPDTEQSALMSRLQKIIMRPDVHQGLSLAGLVMIIAPVLVIEHFIPWPGLMTLIPVSGAMLVIGFARQGTWAHYILTQPYLVGIGLISYSAYLWHQPVFVFARLLSPDGVSPGGYIILILFSLGLAYLTWRYIEQPFRKGLIRLPGRQLYAATAACAAGLVAVGLTLHVTGGLPQRLTAEERMISAGNEYTSPYGKDCLNQIPTSFDSYCRFGDTSGRTVAVVGDSMSTEVSWKLAEHLTGQPIGMQQFTWTGCPPFAGLIRREDPEPCAQFHTKAHQYILESKNIDTVIVVSNWADYFSCPEARQCYTSAERPELVRGRREPEREVAIAAVMDREFDAYLKAGKTIILVYPIPQMSHHVPRYMFSSIKSARRNHDLPNLSLEDHLKRTQVARNLLDRQSAKAGVMYYDPAHALCSVTASGCASEKGGKPLYYDNLHLNGYGADFLSSDIVRMLGVGLSVQVTSQEAQKKA